MICFTWWGLTQYAARSIGAFVKVSKEPVSVVSVRPTLKFKALDSLLGCPCTWIEQGADAKKFMPDVPPRILFISGWNQPEWMSLEKWTRENGGRIYTISDMNFTFDLKHFLRALRFRLTMKKRFDGIFVPGAAARRQMRLSGMPDSKIIEGLYTSDSTLFNGGGPLKNRPKAIVFVGRFSPEKNLPRFATAFAKFHVSHPDWRFDLYGTGPTKDQIPLGPGIAIHDFVQPEQLPEIYRNTRAFVLPSIFDHWGLVVNEAAMCGCFLLLSEAVGSGADLARTENSRLFGAKSERQMIAALEGLDRLGADQLDRAEAVSRERSSHFSLQHFIDGMNAICAMSSGGIGR